MNINKYIVILFFMTIWIILYLSVYKIIFSDYIQINNIVKNKDNENIHSKKKIKFYANLVNNKTCQINILNEHMIDNNIIDLANGKKIFTTIDNQNICTNPEKLFSIVITNLLFNFAILIFGFIIGFVILDLLLNIFAYDHNIIKNDYYNDIEKNNYIK